MRTISLIFDSTDCNAPLPEICLCGDIFIHLVPTIITPIRTSPTAIADNLILGRLLESPTRLGDIDGDKRIEWQYNFEIDETQLLNENEIIASCDIETLCCEDCELKTTVKLIDARVNNFTIATAENCEDLGVGDDRVIKSASISNNVLTMDVAYEHHVDIYAQGNSDDASVDIGLVGEYLIYTEPLILLNSLSECRNEIIYAHGNGIIRVGLVSGGVWQLVVQSSIDGVAFSDFNIYAFGPFGSSHSTTLTIPADYNATLNAGDSTTIQRRFLIRTITEGVGATGGLYSFATALLRWTV